MAVAAIAAFGQSMSIQGINMIKAHEGCLLNAYPDDPEGLVCSVGYGHHSRDFVPGQEITVQLAEIYLQEDVAWINRELSLHVVPEIQAGRKIPAFIPQVLLDAIGDMIFRTGGTTFKASLVMERLKKCRTDMNGMILAEDYRFMAAAIRNYEIPVGGQKEIGITIRQNQLYDLTINGNYGSTQINYRKFEMSDNDPDRNARILSRMK